MRRHFLKPLLLSLLGVLVMCLLAPAADGADGKTSAEGADEKLLREANVGTSGDGLLAYLRDRSGDDADLGQLDQLVKQLGSERFPERDRAAKKLVALGPAAFGRLQEAQQDPDKEITRRAKACAEQIVQGLKPELSRAVVRLLVRQRPEGAAEALLRYLPYGAGEEVTEEVWFGLDALSSGREGPAPVFKEALRDPIPVRRAAAGYVLARRGGQEQRGAAKKLLSDPDAQVRLRTAQGLLGAKDEDAIPALIALLDQPSVAVGWQAEELLRYVAGEGAPAAVIGAGAPPDRKKCRQAWETWWNAHVTKVDLAKLDRQPRRPGLVLLLEEVSREESLIWLTGCDGKPRWKLLLSPRVTDVHLLPGDRLLMTQGERNAYYLRRLRPAQAGGDNPGVTERDLQGKVLWQCKGFLEPEACRRRLDGSTVVISSVEGVAVVAPDGKQIIFHAPEENMGPVQILSDTRILYRDSKANPPANVEFDLATQKASPRYWPPAGPFRVGERRPPAGRNCLWLRGGNTLLGGAAAGKGRVYEYSPDGKIVLEIFAEKSPQLRHCLDLVRLGFDQPRPADLDLSRSVEWRLRGLASKDAAVRRMSVIALGNFAVKPVEAIPALIDALADPDRSVRVEAEDALREIGRPAVDRVRAAVKDKRAPVRAHAITLTAHFLLGHRGRDVDQALSEILAALQKDEDAFVRYRAAHAAGMFRSHAKEVVPALAAALKDKGVVQDYYDRGRQTSVAANAAGALRGFGPAAQPAILALIEASKNGDEMTRYLAVWALGTAGAKDERAIQTLRAILKDKERVELRSMAASALRLIGPEARSAVPDLLEALEVKDVKDPRTADTIRKGVMSALGGIGPEAKDAVPALIQLLRDKRMDPSVRQNAARALGDIGPAAAPAVPALQEATKETDMRIYQTAADALKKIQR